MCRSALYQAGASGCVVTHTFTSVACWMAATDSATRHWPASMGAAQKPGEANSALTVHPVFCTAQQPRRPLGPYSEGCITHFGKSIGYSTCMVTERVFSATGKFTSTQVPFCSGRIKTVLQNSVCIPFAPFRPGLCPVSLNAFYYCVWGPESLYKARKMLATVP